MLDSIPLNRTKNVGFCDHHLEIFDTEVLHTLAQPDADRRNQTADPRAKSFALRFERDTARPAPYSTQIKGNGRIASLNGASRPDLVTGSPNWDALSGDA
jgi:hypothetical protein